MSGDPCCPAPSSPPAGRRSVTRRMAIKSGLALGAVPLLPRLACTDAPETSTGGPPMPLGGHPEPPITKADFGFDPPRPKDEQHVRPMMFPVLPDPVLGKAAWSDSYGAPRGGGTRKHEGQDLMGRKMLKLLACVSGTIAELRHRPTGNSLYLKGDDGWYYCYLHINNDTPGTDDGINRFEEAFAKGLKKGDRVERGDHIAFLGDSGNAENTGAHCHFEIRMPNTNMWKAAAVNARYSLEAAAPAKLNGPKVNPVVPFETTVDFVVRQADDFLGGVPNATWKTAAVTSIDTGSTTADAFIAAQVDHATVISATNPVVRMQLACFKATPDRSRVDTLAALVRGGTSLTEAADRTVTAAGLTASSLTNAEFVVHLDQTMWGRVGSGNQAVARRRRLDQGLSRGALLHEIVQQNDFRIHTAGQVRASTVWMSMLGRTMPTSQFELWSALDKTDATALRKLATMVRSSPEYRTRVT